VILLSADKYHDPMTSPNYTLVTDHDIRAMIKDHLSVNNTVSVAWDENNKPVVRGSKTEGAFPQRLLRLFVVALLLIVVLISELLLTCVRCMRAAG
jgi:hypothetical protein